MDQRWNWWLRFCNQLSPPIEPLAADEDALSLFATWLSLRGRDPNGPSGAPLSATTIRQYVSAVHYNYQANGIVWPDSSGRLRRTLTGIDNTITNGAPKAP